MSRDVERLEHIIECCDKIINYISCGKRNEMAKDAIERNLTIIGEACRVLSDDIKNQYPDIPWAGIRGMRNVLVHEYYLAEEETVWDVAEHKIPALKYLIIGILEQLDD